MIRPIVIAGPSGSGKAYSPISTLSLNVPSQLSAMEKIKKLQEYFPNKFAFTVSHTTRTARPLETHGKEYFFVSKAEMEDMIKNEMFIEHANYSGNLYGTSKAALSQVTAAGSIPLLDIDMQGVISILKANLEPKPAFIFIKPASIETLRSRLNQRGDTSPRAIEKRIQQAEWEMETSKRLPFDASITNDNLEVAFEEFKQAVVHANPFFSYQ